MGKLILLSVMAATALPLASLPTAATAQTRQDVRKKREELREDRRELREDIRSGEPRGEIRRDRQEVRQGQRALARSRAAYVAPVRGWRYRAVAPGYQLQPTFYGTRYTISNYDAYRLQAPGTNRRSVRYGNDLLLINARNGRVVQVLRNRY
jgi:Ni/Co efflux regulator RcnB